MTFPPKKDNNNNCAADKLSVFCPAPTQFDKQGANDVLFVCALWKCSCCFVFSQNDHFNILNIVPKWLRFNISIRRNVTSLGNTPGSVLSYISLVYRPNRVFIQTNVLLTSIRLRDIEMHLSEQNPHLDVSMS